MREEQKVVGEAVLGFYLAHEFWGQGFASEAGRALVEFGFGELKLKRIVTAVQVGNAASVRILEKLGFLVTSHEVGPRSFTISSCPGRWVARWGGEEAVCEISGVLRTPELILIGLCLFVVACAPPSLRGLRSGRRILRSRCAGGVAVAGD